MAKTWDKARSSVVTFCQMIASGSGIDSLRDATRRQFLQKIGWGIGGAALHTLLAGDGLAEDADVLDRGLHFSPKAKNVIYIHLVGAPSHLDLYDPKPELQKRNGELCPDEFFVGKKLAFIRKQPSLLGTPKEDKIRIQEVWLIWDGDFKSHASPARRG